MPEDKQELDPMEEELNLDTASHEFKIARSTLNYWMKTGQIDGRQVESEVRTKYWLVKRGAVIKFLANRPKRGRPLKRQKPNA